MFQNKFRRMASIILAMLGLIGIAYGAITLLQQFQTAERDAQMTNAFIEIIPQTTPSTTRTDHAPIAVTDLLKRSIISNAGLRAQDSQPALADASLFDALLTPFVDEARKRRAELAKRDPAYFERVDRELNEGRINFLLFGYGETHEPPLTEKALIGSHTIISYDLRTHRADLISFTHDIRAPEIEHTLAERGVNSPPVRIDQAYSVGGFKLMRHVIENATGLSIDFQVTFRDTVMQGLVDQVFEGVNVNVPMTFDVYPFYLDGQKYAGGRFVQGKQKLTGRQVIQFIKTVPVSEPEYSKVVEHNARKSLVFDAMLDALAQKHSDRGFWFKASAFVAGELFGGNIVYDFDPLPLLINNLGTTTSIFQRATASDETASMRLPKIHRSKYIVDSAHGDGGVQWLTANAAENPITQRDIGNGVYPSLDLAVPVNANPYGDLVTEYWTSVRNLVKYSLLAKEPVFNFYLE